MKIRGLDFSYGDKLIFSGFDLDVPSGKSLCIMGGSGTGKTTLVNCICRQLDFGGDIDFEDEKSKIAYVFQQPRLIPSMSVEDNIKFVLPKGMDKISIANKVDRVIAQLRLEDCRKSYPSKISGGQASRTAIARAMVTDCDLLILDEPFKGLDVKLKREIIDILINLIEGKSVIFITHDPEEALAIGDRICVFERNSGEGVRIKGEIEISQCKSQRDMYGEYINNLRQKAYEIL